MTEDQDSAARLHLFASVAFSVVSGLLLVALFLSLRFPTVVGQLPQLTYGRLKPMVLTTAVLGWLTLAGIGAVYYLLPRLTGAPMWGERIARLNLMVSVPIYAAAALAPVLGLSSGQELLEVPWYLDLLDPGDVGGPVGSHHPDAPPPHRGGHLHLALVRRGRGHRGVWALGGGQPARRDRRLSRARWDDHRAAEGRVLVRFPHVVGGRDRDRGPPTTCSPRRRATRCSAVGWRRPASGRWCWRLFGRLPPR